MNRKLFTEVRPLYVTSKENPHVIPLTVCPHSGGLATTLCQEQLPANDSRLRLMEGWFDVANLPCQDCPLHKRDETLTVDDKDE